MQALWPIAICFRNLYEITESGDAEKALIAAVTRKHQIEADRVIGGIGSAAAVTMLRDVLLSTALYVCLACAAPVLGALTNAGGSGKG